MMWKGYLTAKKQDEYATPPYAVYPVLEFISKKKFKKIWCPFDKDDSYYVRILKNAGYEVINTHIETGRDFFNTDIDCDVIISNPPYSIKDDVLERLYFLNKPFMMLLPIPALQGKRRYNFFERYGLELLLFDKRIMYGDKMTHCFATGYFCYKVLDNKIEFRRL